MSQEHTPEPWTIHTQSPTFIRANGGRKHVGNADSMGDQETNEANARRIVACVNACAGITTADIENMPGTLADLVRLYVSTSNESDDLLAALHVSRARIQIDRDSLFDCHKNLATETVTDELGLRGLAEYDDVLRTIDSAIGSEKNHSAETNKMVERKCCGTFFRTPHRSTCPNWRGKKGGAA